MAARKGRAARARTSHKNRRAAQIYRLERMAVCGVIGALRRIVPIFIDLDRRRVIAGGCLATLAPAPRDDGDTAASFNASSAGSTKDGAILASAIVAAITKWRPTGQFRGELLDHLRPARPLAGFRF
jgi:hypothetical protein